MINVYICFFFVLFLSFNCFVRNLLRLSTISLCREISTATRRHSQRLCSLQTTETNLSSLFSSWRIPLYVGQHGGNCFAMVLSYVSLFHLTGGRTRRQSVSVLFFSRFKSEVNGGENSRNLKEFACYVICAVSGNKTFESEKFWHCETN